VGFEPTRPLTRPSGFQDVPDFVPSCGVASSAGHCVGQSDGVVTFEYRVIIERGGGELVVMHYRADKLWPGATFTANEPGTEHHGVGVVVERVASHPTDDAPGIAYGRLADPR
jgi:hypothetical protein